MRFGRFVALIRSFDGLETERMKKLAFLIQGGRLEEGPDGLDIDPFEGM